MTKINENFLKIPASYLFSDISKKITEYKEQNPSADIIKMGIGDVTMPLPKASVDAIIKATKEQLDSATFRGYGPEQGYDFLRNAIVKNDFNDRNIDIEADEIFVSDGAKSDSGNIGDIFDKDNVVALANPSYPVYIDTNAMAGRAGEIGESGLWNKIYYLNSNAENSFVPELPKTKVDIIYLCYPNNPTGTTLTKSQLKLWVDYARENQSIILFDSAYEAFITEDDVPRSIYEIEGAKQVAIEFRSFSKTAGFTGTRCGYTVVPKALTVKANDGSEVSLNKLWLRRQTTKFNGTPYIVQRGAEAVYSTEGKKEVKALINYYLENAKIIKSAIEALGLSAYGGVNSPYVWVKTPDNMGSWEFFDYLLTEKNIVCTPGSGFGMQGEGYVRFSSFAKRDAVITAMGRLKE